MPLTSEQQAEIVRLAADNAHDMSLREIGAKFGVSKQRVNQILNAHGIKKEYKRGKVKVCKKCGDPFRGDIFYSGANARYCPKHRSKKPSNA